MASETLKTLLIGVGDPHRGDEAMGQWICEQAAKLKLPNLHVRPMKLLTIELLDQLQNFSAVIIAESGKIKTAATLEELDGSEDGYDSQHYSDAVTLKTLHRNLYQQSIVWHALTVKGVKFEKGTPLSKEALSNGAEGIKLLKQHLSKKVVED